MMKNNLRSLVLLVSMGLGASSLMAQKKSTVPEATPDYATVFPSNKVNRIDLVMKPADWQSMQVALDTAFGKMKMGMPGGMPPGMGGDSMRGPGGGFFPMASMPGGDSLHNRGRGFFPMPPGGGRDSGFMRPPMQGGFGGPMPGMNPPDGMRGGPGGGKGGPGSEYKAAYLCCSLLFNGKQWNGVGFRLKGNSSLMAGYSSTNQKMPFRLEFDKFSDSLPATRQQRFFGFNKLSFSNNTKDNSFLREKMTNDLFRAAGVKSPHAAFYRVYIDYGSGPVYFGLYTAVEIVEDTMLDDQFGDGSGNCYKPDGNGASFAAGSFDTESFEKKNHKKKADWSDVQALYTCLNSDVRKTNPSAWRSQLESLLDVPSFLNWLAVNSTIQNWDTYGQMTHNYYLYHNPSSGKLVWIPWDNNEALTGDMHGGSTLSQASVNERWPLIRYLLDQPEYMAMYRQMLQAFVVNVFNIPYLQQQVEQNVALITPYVTGKEGEVKGHTLLRSEQAFVRAKAELLQHIAQRNKAVEDFLKTK
jgi:spore coat protein H